MTDTIRDPKEVKIKRALLSVSDKTGIVEFAQKLATYDVELLSTGGTAKALKDAGLTVIDVSDYTGSPEMMDGRVKTLHPKIHGGFLGRRDNQDHLQAMKDNNIGEIDLLVINLYPFVETLKSGADFDTCIENIDIGGPAMIRSASKNFDFCTVATNEEDYEQILEEMSAHDGAVTHALRKKLAAHAYALTATYDANISRWFAHQIDETNPARISFSGSLKQSLRYGENPHQDAALYLDGSDRPGVATASQIQGKELSYNNLNDTDAAYELVAEFDAPAVAIIK
ncbi:MAG: bifunctional phosphoribosylaminoimidazolecarboxamide formyltransferase/IMP cyclohydrolase, partial [Bdellovibrionales bacterium]